MLRVAALQFAFSADARENQEACLRLIDQAAREHQAALMVLPAFTAEPNHGLDPLDNPFLVAVAARAKQHAAHISVHCSVWPEPEARQAAAFLFGPDGSVLLRFASDAESAAPAVADAEHGRLALLDDDVRGSERARQLAAAGAQVLCQSLHALVHADVALHVPARAAENRCFMVAANLVTVALPGEATPADGAGASQIVGPDGRVLAKAPAGEEAIVVAEIDPAQALPRTPDAPTEEHAAEDDAPAAMPDREQPTPARTILPPPNLLAAVWTPEADTEDLVEAACQAAAAFAAEGGELLVLPELFCFPEAVSDDSSVDADAFEPVVRALCESVRGSQLHVATSLVEAAGDDCFVHTGVLLGQAGIIARQPQLRPEAAHAWSVPGKRLEVLPMPYGGLSLLVGDDAADPGLMQEAVRRGAVLLAAPIDHSHSWDGATPGLAARAGEAGLSLLAASREVEGRHGLIFDAAQARSTEAREMGVTRVALGSSGGESASEELTATGEATENQAATVPEEATANQAATATETLTDEATSAAKQNEADADAETTESDPTLEPDKPDT